VEELNVSQNEEISSGDCIVWLAGGKFNLIT
jgi:hypothetical protein